jgi:hypothetical protein
MFTGLWTKAIAILVLITAILSSYWYVYNAGKRNQQMQTIVEVAKANEAATKSFNNLWDLYVAEQGNTKERVVKVVKEIEKIVERPVYSNVCIDEEGKDKINEILVGGGK